MAPLRFVVHEHRARSHHFDLRLEVGGALASWAVPKGPSMNPAERRLAIEVEDHPLEYAAFEGVIPEGLPGAGPVVVWDEGELRPLEDPEPALARGRFSFRLDGRKLRGEFALVLLRGRPGPRSQWLLMKKRDGDADRGFRLRSELTPARLRALARRVPPCAAS